MDEKGRVREPIEWSENSSFVNQFSEMVASNSVGYKFKQWIADIVLGDFDKEATNENPNVSKCLWQYILFEQPHLT
jgi:hypothetical protein